MKSIFWTPRHEFNFCSALPFWWAPSFGEVDLLDPEACEFIFYSALLLVKSIFWTPRHEFVLLPLLWVPSFSGVDFVDPEVRIYFLQCSSCDEIDRLDPEARVCHASLVVGALFQWSRSCWPRGANLFFTVDHSLTSRLWAFFVSLQQIRWKKIFVCTKVVIPLLKSFQHHCTVGPHYELGWLGQKNFFFEIDPVAVS